MVRLHRQVLSVLFFAAGRLAGGSLPENAWGDSELARAVYRNVQEGEDDEFVWKDLAGVRDEEPTEAEEPGATAVSGDSNVICRNLRPPDSHILPKGHGAVREELLRAVEKEWHAADEPGLATEKFTQKESSLEEKLRTILIPKICFRDTPFHDAVDLLAEIAEELDWGESGKNRGINIAFRDDPDGAQPVHMTLRNVELGRAIQLLAQCADFEWEVDGDVVLLSSAEKNCERLRTRFFPLSRATVLRMTNMRQMQDGEGQIAREERLLQEFFQNSGVDFCEFSGSALAYDGSWLIVTQTPRNLLQVENILRRYDRAKQVEIEAKFIEVQQGALDELQFRWHAARDGTKKISLETDGVVRAIAQAFSPQNGTSSSGAIVLEPDGGGAEKRIPIANVPPTPPSSANVGQNSVPLIDVMGVIGGTQIGFVLRALEQQTGADLMSAPKVTVLSGKTAEIVVAQEFRYPEEYDPILSSVGTSSGTLNGSSAGVTITAGTPRNFKTRNIGVEMRVTPIVEADDRISLRLEPSVTEFEGFVEYGGSSIAVSGGSTVTVPSGFFQPIFSTRRIATEVTIDDGATVVMGGLTREEVKSVRDKIPFLGSIPILGRIFRSSGQSSQKRNLLIFVTARLSDSPSIDGLAGEIVRVPRDGETRKQPMEKRGTPNGWNSIAETTLRPAAAGGPADMCPRRDCPRRTGVRRR
ncbi:MAG: hypothetical protein LBF24_02945, partial [Puniceicoccales bacterium]|nr:hypothetical protein [Puniceicoccales bacterium]